VPYLVAAGLGTNKFESLIDHISNRH